MNLTTTFWSTPMNLKRWNVDDQIKHTLMMCALCVTYAKRNGAHITMHCDAPVYTHLISFGYDEVYNDLNDLDKQIEKTSPTVMWAAGKFVSLEKEPLGTIHIDNDVFLKSTKCIEAMNFDDYDMICQHIENSHYPEQNTFRDLIKVDNMDVEYACCVGIVGFNNEELREKYINNYRYYMKNLEFDPKDDKFVNADLILEQVYLYNQLDKYKCKYLIGDVREDDITKIQKNAIDLKYEHVIGYSKYSTLILKKLYKTLSVENPELYKYIMNLS